jgi:prepilin-type N-terminal cleavage/methylation domain-containing protein
MKDRRGFTLIELLIVVGIVGILSSLAIGGYNRFIIKTKRSEVVSNLDAIYKAETAYFSESNRYSDSFVDIRWKPEGKNYFTYTVGAEYFGILPAMNPEPDTAGVVGGTLPATAATSSFTAYGWGNFDQDPKVDVWYINDMKVLVNQADDLQ